MAWFVVRLWPAMSSAAWKGIIVAWFQFKIIAIARRNIPAGQGNGEIEMEFTSIGAVNGLSDYISTLNKTQAKEEKSNTFETLFQSALQMLNETNDNIYAAREAELSYAMGLTTSTTDVQVAQWKANLSLQYTVAIRNAVLDAYKEIMQLQF